MPFHKAPPRVMQTHGQRVSSESSHAAPHLALIAAQRDEGDVTQPGVLLPPRRPHLAGLRGPQGAAVLGTGADALWGERGPKFGGLQTHRAPLRVWSYLHVEEGGEPLP